MTVRHLKFTTTRRLAVSIHFNFTFTSNQGAVLYFLTKNRTDVRTSFYHLTSASARPQSLHISPCMAPFSHTCSRAKEEECTPVVTRGLVHAHVGVSGTTAGSVTVQVPAWLEAWMRVALMGRRGWRGEGWRRADGRVGVSKVFWAN